jgi:hypothetical protein
MKNTLTSNRSISELTSYDIERKKKMIGYIHKTQAKKEITFCILQG